MHPSTRSFSRTSCHPHHSLPLHHVTMDLSCAVTGRDTLEELATESPVAAVVCRPLLHPLAVDPLSVTLRRPWAYRGHSGGHEQHPSVVPLEDERRVQHTVCGTMARLASAISQSLPALETNHTPSLSLSTIIKSACCSTVLYYTVLPSCPVLYSCPHTHTHMHTYVFGTAWFLAACVLDTHHFEPDKSPPFQSLKCLGCCSFTSTAAALRCTARHWLHCTGTTGLDWTGWRRWAWLPSERASKAVELLRCAPGLPVPLSPLHSVHCPLSNFYSLGPPVNSNPPFHPSSPD